MTDELVPSENIHFTQHGDTITLDILLGSARLPEIETASDSLPSDTAVIYVAPDGVESEDKLGLQAGTYVLDFDPNKKVATIELREITIIDSPQQTSIANL